MTRIWLNSTLQNRWHYSLLMKWKWLKEGLNWVLTESIRKLSNFYFRLTKTLYQNILSHIAFYTFQGLYMWLVVTFAKCQRKKNNLPTSPVLVPMFIPNHFSCLGENLHYKKSSFLHFCHALGLKIALILLLRHFWTLNLSSFNQRKKNNIYRLARTCNSEF